MDSNVRMTDVDSSEKIAKIFRSIIGKLNSNDEYNAVVEAYNGDEIVEKGGE